ncbi:MAG: histidine kinase [Treponema sp.]|jgi:signal transduction histidine kinase|nr:histidine kinase [Treponema sp.]
MTVLFLLLHHREKDYVEIYSFGFMIYFFMGTLAFLPFSRSPPLFFCLVLLDYFSVLLYQYFDPYVVFMEVLWLPELLSAASLVVPVPLNIPFTLFLGIPCYLFLSYGYCYSLKIAIGPYSCAYSTAALFYTVPVSLFAAAVGQIRSYTAKLREKASSLELMNMKLDKINHQITDRMFSLQNDTTLEERKRISKEIHDTAGYVFINLIMMLQAALAILHKDIEKADQLINDARDYADRGINEIRHILRDIRDYTPASISLQNELLEIGKSFKKATDVGLTIEYGNWPVSFSKTTDAFFKSFMQEALTNALKHGHATDITIICWKTGTHLIMSVADNGEGVNTTPIIKGIGISSIEDFVSRRNGAITIQSGGRGFKISVSIPRESG